MPGWIVVVEWTTHLVLVLLVGLSVWSVSIMIDRRRFFKSLEEFGLQTPLEMIEQKKWDELKKWVNEHRGIRAGTLGAAIEAQSKDPEKIDRAVRSYLFEKKEELETSLTILATLGSNAPFIGLFGTVLGIIQAFGELAAQNSGTASIMSAISAALIATAVGLFVAIPAVVAFNIYTKKVQTILGECEGIRDFYISRLE